MPGELDGNESFGTNNDIVYCKLVLDRPFSGSVQGPRRTLTVVHEIRNSCMIFMFNIPRTTFVDDDEGKNDDDDDDPTYDVPGHIGLV